MKFKIPLISSDELEIEINPSEKVVFLGANGSGKSRLGEFINKAVFNKTTIGLEQINHQIINKDRELNLTNSNIENLTSQFLQTEQIENFNLVQYGSSYQKGLIPIGNGEVKTRLEILDLFFKNQIQVENVSFKNNRLLSGSMPIQSLDEIEGGTISFGEIVFEIDLMKIDESKPETLTSARQYLINKIEIELKSERQKKTLLEGEIEKLKSDLESSQVTSFDFSHRIAAHRSLVVNENLQISSSKDSINKLLYGNTHQFDNNLQKNNAVGTIQNDYNDLITAFLAEEAELGAQLNQKNITEEEAITVLSETLSIWNELISNKQLTRDGLKIIVYKNESFFSLSKLSEGERSILYIIGQCLFSPHNSIIIIDEPDLHIHKSIISDLFDKIESKRKDCAFIYITHDIDFITSRIAEKYAIKDFIRTNDNGNDDKWDIVKIEENDDIPEDILNLIVGSKKPILFVEGEIEKKSLDRIYQSVYPEFKVILAHNCAEVIKLTKAGNRLEKHLRLKCFGLIDADGRTNEKLEELKSESIHALPVAIIENLFLRPDVAIFLYQITGVSESFKEQEFIKKSIEWLNASLHWQTNRTKEKIKLIFESKINSFTQINDFSENPITIIPKDYFDETKKEWDELMEGNNSFEKLINLLKLSRNKGILGLFATELGLKNKRALESRIIQNSDKLSEILKDILPKIS
ncbi:AAA family ATPase [Flavobacterium sp.]|uniref:AAA family ATPase n=1 Tax=Flavobacterium sp. TaxID=239 RepID=UPI00286F8FE0|nr:AAA family ATPase [Flavobacterium sp.]